MDELTVAISRAELIASLKRAQRSVRQTEDQILISEFDRVVTLAIYRMDRETITDACPRAWARKQQDLFGVEM